MNNTEIQDETEKQSGFWGRLFFGLSNTTKLEEGEKKQVAGSVTVGDGDFVSTERALKLSVVWSCVKIRSQVAASLPLKLKMGSGEDAKDHPMHRLVHRRPNQVQTAYSFWQTVCAHIDMYGNSFVEIRRAAGAVSLHIVDPETVELEKTRYGLRYYINDVSHNPDNILHFKGFSLDGLLGLSPITYLAETISHARKTGKTLSDSYNNGLKAGGFMYTGEGVLKPDHRRRMRNALKEFSKPENAGKWMLLEAGQKAEPVSNRTMTPADAELNATRKQLITEICSALGVHPSMIGYSVDGETYGGTLEQLNLQFLQYHLNPLLVGIEQELEFKLLKLTEQDSYEFKHSIEGLLRADSKSRAEIMRTQVTSGIRTTNEVRALDDMPPLKGGDVPVRQVQYQPLGTPLNTSNPNEEQIGEENNEE